MNFSSLLRIAVVLVNKKKEGGMPCLERDVLLADVYAKGLGLRYQMVQPVDGEFGRLLPGGNWTGAVGMVLRNEADISVSLVLTEERVQVLPFSFPCGISEVTFVTHKPQLLAPTYAFLRPFTIEIWIVLLATVIVMSAIFYLCLHEKYKYETVLTTVVGSLLRQSWTLQLGTTSKNVVLISWLIGAMLITFAYTAVILSFLTFPPRSGIRDTAGLAKAVTEGTHQCITFKGSIIPHLLSTSEDRNVRLIGQNLKKNPGNGNMLDVLEPPEKRLVYFGTRSILSMLKDLYFIPEDDFFPAWGAPAYGKMFCCKDKLENVIIRAYAAGIIYKIDRDVFFTSNMPQIMKLESSVDETNLLKPLSLSDMWGAFFVLITGYIFAVLIFMTEVVYFKMSKKYNI